MSKDTAIVIFHIKQRNFITDLEVPLHISANDIVIALNEARIFLSIPQRKSAGL